MQLRWDGRFRWTVAIAFGLLAVAATAPAADIDPTLEAQMSVLDRHQTVSALIYLWDSVDIEMLNDNLGRERAGARQRHQIVVSALQERAKATQPALLAELKDMQVRGLVRDFKPFWIANVIRVDATAEAIDALADRADIEYIYYNYEIELIEPVGPGSEPPPPPVRDRTPEPGLIAVRAPEAWALGYTGDGILVATLDTGVDGNHEALASRWRGVADPRYAGHPDWAWFDPVTSTTFPQSFGSHGTHTMGTVCGGAPGDEVGVAPGAQWIHAAVIDRVDIPTTVADAIASFEWMLDPDGNPGTYWDVPQVCSNSWRVTTSHGYPPCDETFWTYLDACEAAGTVILFSAGNEGSGAETVGRPPDRATDDFRCFAVGAVDGNTAGWPIASFSSRGPSHCTPDASAAIKPEVVAPGVTVRSSVPGGGYESSGWSGTSMASPHVNGAVALILEACPDLTVEEVKQILLATAVDLGTTGEDNDYGMGIIDVYEAVVLAESWCGPSPPRAKDGYYETGVDTAVLVTLLATDYDGEPDPPGMVTYKVISLPGPGNTLTDAGNSHVIVAGDLPYTLVGGGNEVLYTPTGGFWGNDTFQFVGDDGGTPPDGGESDPATVTVLVMFPPPTITTTALPEGYLNCPYPSYQIEAVDGQPTLSWTVAGEGAYSEADLGTSYFSSVGTAQGWHADDSTWNYTLPFAFPFYGEEFTVVTVSSNGWVNFGPWSGSSWSNSTTELINNRRIAPLWDDLRTDQSGTDIYIWNPAPNEVTFRWDAVTYSGLHPVNVSCTLYADGRIRFHYGSGNTPLTPTIGVSNGDGVYYLLSMYNNAGSLTNANSLEISPPAPLPEGMYLTAAGELAGQPTESGVFAPRVRVTDSLERSDELELTLVINAEGPEIGDLDCDGCINFGDVNPFVLALTDADGYAAQYPGCDRMRADVNDDGLVDFGDINPFVQLLVP